MTEAEERLVRHERRRRVAAAITEAELFDAHGLPIAEALIRIRLEPRRRCPCAGHRKAMA